MLEIQQSAALNCSSHGSPGSSSLAVDLRSTQKLVKRNDDNGEGFVLAHRDNLPTDSRGFSPAQEIGNQSTLMNLPLCELENNRQGTTPSNGALQLSGPDRNSQMTTVQSIAVGAADPSHEKHFSGHVSLRNVLSDTISGVLMEDAMITPCGHSFGIIGLRRVIETNLCLTCGVSVHSDSLIPNHALRAAVLAYKQEGTRRKKDMQAESEGKRFSPAFADLDVSRSKGVQFPYVANDRVLIKGNKRTPERFVGREAIITTQCLNGWYLVKTLDNGESVRLQYRSLQKVGDEETLRELDGKVSSGRLSKRACKFNSLRGPSMSLCPNSFSADCNDVSPSKVNDTIRTSSVPLHIINGICSESLSKTNRSNHGQGGNQSQTADASVANWHNGRTSSNSSQELQGEQVKVLELRKLQVHGRYAQEAMGKYDMAEDDNRVTKRMAALGTITGGSSDGLDTHTNCSVRERKAMNSKIVKQTDDCVAELEVCREMEGEHVVVGCSHGARSRGKYSRARPKLNSLQTHSFVSDTADFQGGDPYRKVYVSGVRRRGSGGDMPGLVTSRQSAFSSLNMDQETEIKTSGESNCSQNVASFCETIRKGMLDLETEIPWSCLQSDWKTRQAEWLQMLQKSSTLKDVGRRLEELRSALVLEKAGNMSDDEWSKMLEAAVEFEVVDAVDSLWNRLHEDVSKLMDSKLKRHGRPWSNTKFEFLESKNSFPDLCGGGLSCVGMIAATSIAAAEAYAVGEQNIETLLAIPIKLVQEHSNQDLQAVIDAIEREKRHLLAKVANLSSRSNTKANSEIENADNVPLENSKQVPLSPSFHAVKSLTEPVLVRSEDYDAAAAPLLDADSQEEAAAMQDTDGEETDLSDSD